MNALKRCGLSMAIVFNIHVVFSQNLYYVAITGNDANPGTLSLPWRTLAKAGAVAQAGDTVYIRSGTYNETLAPANSGTAGNLITFKAYPGDECEGNSSAQAKELKTNCQVIIDGQNVRDYGVDLWKKNFIRIEGLDIRNTKDHLIYVQSYGETGAEGLQIINNYLHDGKRGEGANTAGIEAIGTLENILVENNEVTRVYNALRIGKGNNVILRGNHLWDFDCDGVGHGIAYNMLIENNYIHSGTFTTSCHQDGLDLYPQKHLQGNINLVIRNNWIFDLTQLIYIVPCCDGSEASNTDFSGIHIYGNVLYTVNYQFPPAIFLDFSWDNSSNPITNFDVHDINIHSNTIGWLGTYWGILIDRKSGRTVDGVKIRNNIMYDNHAINLGNGITNVTSDYNLFYNTTPPPSFEGPNSIVGQNPQFQNYTGQNSVAFDFRLQSTSPAIDKGGLGTIVAPANFTDLWGTLRPQDGPDGDLLTQYDMGAYEYFNTAVAVNNNLSADGNVIIYPNPFSTSATIEVNPFLSKEMEQPAFLLYDVFGREIKPSVTRTDHLKFTMRKEDLPNGMYFYKIVSGEKKIAAGKLLIE